MDWFCLFVQFHSYILLNRDACSAVQPSVQETRTAPQLQYNDDDAWFYRTGAKMSMSFYCMTHDEHVHTVRIILLRRTRHGTEQD